MSTSWFASLNRSFACVSPDAPSGGVTTGTSDDVMTRAAERDATSHALVVVTKKVLEKVIKESELAVLEVTEKLQGMSSLTEQQKEMLSGAMVSFYQSDEGDDIKRILNDNAQAMVDAAERGDFAAVDALASADDYQHARKATKKLHDTLQNVTTSDAALNDYIMPVLVALQFQDNVRQELEALIRCTEDYFQEFHIAESVRQQMNPETVSFWRRLSKHFTNIEARDLVLKTALGESEAGHEKDVRESA
jgi:hypothetical protein